MIPFNIATDLLSTYLMKGDLIGFLMALYTSTMGDLFYGLLVVAFTIPLWIKTGSFIYVAAIWMLIGFTLEALIPSPALSLGKVLLVLAVAAILFKVFLGGGGD